MKTKLGIGSYAYAWSIGVSGYAQPSVPMSHLDFLQEVVNQGVGVAQIADAGAVDKP